MSSFNPWPAFEKKVPKIQERFGIVNNHGLAWAKWTTTIIVFHSKGQSLTVLPFSCFIPSMLLKLVVHNLKRKSHTFLYSLNNNTTSLRHFVIFDEKTTPSIRQPFCDPQTCHTKEGEWYILRVLLQAGTQYSLFPVTRKEAQGCLYMLP